MEEIRLLLKTQYIIESTVALFMFSMFSNTLLTNNQKKNLCVVQQ
jgi:hypothetical protein